MLEKWSFALFFMFWKQLEYNLYVAKIDIY